MAAPCLEDLKCTPAYKGRRRADEADIKFFETL